VDESQLEVNRNSVKFKLFDTKEEAAAFQIEGKRLSDVGHAPNGKYFRAYCRAGELACKAVNMAGEHYKLNIPLTAGYMVGTTWATCH